MYCFLLAHSQKASLPCREKRAVPVSMDSTTVPPPITTNASFPLHEDYIRKMRKRRKRRRGRRKRRRGKRRRRRRS